MIAPRCEAPFNFAEESKMGHVDALECPQDTTAGTNSVSMPADEAAAGPHGTSKIMIVDDEPVNIAVNRKYLKAAGYVNFVTTTDPTQAINLVRRRIPTSSSWIS